MICKIHLPFTTNVENILRVSLELWQHKWRFGKNAEYNFEFSGLEKFLSNFHKFFQVPTHVFYFFYEKRKHPKGFVYKELRLLVFNQLERAQYLYQYPQALASRESDAAALVKTHTIGRESNKTKTITMAPSPKNNYSSCALQVW